MPGKYWLLLIQIFLERISKKNWLEECYTFITVLDKVKEKDIVDTYAHVKIKMMNAICLSYSYNSDQTGLWNFVQSYKSKNALTNIGIDQIIFLGMPFL